jgi:hypothetical protein
MSTIPQCQMAVRLSAVRTGRALLPPNCFSASVTHLCQMLSEPQGSVWPEGLGKLKIINLPSSGLEPATFRLVAKCLIYYAITCPHMIIPDSYIRQMNNEKIKPCLREISQARRHVLVWGTAVMFPQFLSAAPDGRIDDR